MIIWSGLGFLGLVIPFFLALITQYLTDSLLNQPGYYTNHSTLQFIVIIVSAVFIYFLSQKLKNNPGRKLIDKATGKEFTLRQKHTLFFLDLKYWPLILVIFAFYFILT
ncbi:hypothetical protein KBC75_01780 [Candidatus Shapirobacteria bacterium]|nr:hypothetical protein [Candidatus Shapirobacteria bacterium]